MDKSGWIPPLGFKVSELEDKNGKCNEIGVLQPDVVNLGGIFCFFPPGKFDSRSLVLDFTLFDRKRRKYNFWRFVVLSVFGAHPPRSNNSSGFNIKWTSCPDRLFTHFPRGATLFDRERESTTFGVLWYFLFLAKQCVHNEPRTTDTLNGGGKLGTRCAGNPL